MKINTEQKFILVLFILSLVTKLAIASIFVDPPDIPHDFPRYLDSAKTVLQGKNPYVDYSPEFGPSLYGPLFSVFMAAWIGLFGDDYTLLKIPEIIFEALSIVLIFYIVKITINSDAAKYASILYAFSYVAFASSAVEGRDDILHLFVTLIAIWYLVKSSPNLKLSAIFMGVAISIKLLPLVIYSLPITYYIYQKRGMKAVFEYMSLSIITLVVIYLQFYLKAGLNVLYPYHYVLDSGPIPPIGLTISAWLNMLLNYFTLTDWTQTLEVPNPVVRKLGLPFMLFGLFFAIYYMLKFRIHNKESELFRNIFLILFMITLFAAIGDDSMFITVVPPAVFLFALEYSDKFRMSRTEIMGIILVLASIIIYSSIYRWRVDYSSGQRLLLALGILFSFAGTYLTLIKSEFKLSWSLVVLSYAAYRTTHADLLRLVGPVIPMFRDYRMAWGAWAFGMPIIFVIPMALLFYKIHKKISVKMR